MATRVSAITERPQTLGEEIANSVTHGLGFAASIALAPLLVIAGVRSHDPWRVVAASIFAATLIMLYAASTLYHALHGQAVRKGKAVFQRLDHAAIYLLIAGTYTPFLLVSLRGPWGWTLFAIVWTLAVLGVVLKSVFGTSRLAALSTGVYVGMGWLSVVAIRPLMQHVAPSGLWWLVAGGVCYTGGVVFFVWERLRYSHALWHLFVLAGSVCHTWAVLGYVLMS
ncbi:MAG: hemolysin III family protein [Gemmatimonadaceae bacterium]